MKTVFKAHSKYGNIKQTIDGHKFDSKKEANRYMELKLLEKGKAISDLELQPEYPIVVNGQKVCTYIADFKYIQKGKEVIEDTKSSATKTPTYRLKNKLMKAIYDIDIVEV